MSSIRFLQLLSLSVILKAHICGGAVTECNPTFTWVSTPCRYKCRCTFNRCDSNGECTQSSICKKGWFGPSCQYADLVGTSTSPVTPTWVYDFPDTLCNPGQETVTVSLTGMFYFTWLRLQSDAPVGSQDFSLQLMYANGSTVECSNMYTSRVNDTVLDMHCQPGTFFQKLTITGDGVKSLCSVYISGGRNIALGQNTLQSSDYQHYPSWLAVDGDTNPNLHYRSCSHTGKGNTSSWKLTFERPHQVNIYIIYNRDSNQQRLWGFILEADQKNKSLAFNYTAPYKTSLDIYRIPSTTPHIPVSEVTVFAKYNLGDGIYVTLCEVEMFGDSVCPAGQYGRECEKTCNCAKDGENCFVSTGGCPSGCAAGYQGEGCQNTCPPTKFGKDCNETCSTYCAKQLCDSVTGQCAACGQGLTNDFCDHNNTMSSSLLAAIVGPVVAFVVLVTLIPVGVLIWRRRRHNLYEHRETTTLRFQNVAETDSMGTGISNAVTTKPEATVPGHSKIPVMKTPNDTQDYPDIHQHQVDGGYCNLVPRLNEIPTICSDEDFSEHAKTCNNKVNSVETNRGAAVSTGPSSKHQSKDRFTEISDSSGYEILTNSPAMIQKSQGLKYEDGVTYFDTMANPYENDDNVPNTYEEIHGV